MWRPSFWQLLATLFLVAFYTGPALGQTTTVPAAAVSASGTALDESAAPGQATALTLAGTAGRFDAWPGAQVLFDAEHRFTLADVMARREAFATPEVPRANFGPRKETVWLHIPVRAMLADRWLLEIDYPPLKRIEAWLVRDGHVVQHGLMGSDIDTAERPIRSRAHVMPIDLVEGLSHDVYLKIDSATTVVTPIRFHREAAFVAYESQRMLLLGLMFGAPLLLVVTTLVNGFSLRDPAYFYYGFMLLGVSMFFVSYSGLGHQFLWSSQAGYLEKVSPIGALFALTAASFFVIAALDMHERSPRLARCLQVAALCALTAAVGASIGVFDYRQASLAATTLGPIQIVMALVESVRQTRAGSRMALYMVIGWGAYAVGSMSLAGLLRGVLPVDFITQNLFQFSSLVEMFAWMRVLAIRIEIIRTDAERIAAERQALHDLANTDALTGLRNRRGIVDAIEAALGGSHRQFAVYLIDLDGFKAVNDQHGHEAGDETLVQVGQRLTAVLREQDLVARLGGDEFVVLARGVSNTDAAQRIRSKMVEAIRVPFDLAAGQQVRIGATVGIAMAPLDADGADGLLRVADAAMYAGKPASRHDARQPSHDRVEELLSV